MSYDDDYQENKLIIDLDRNDLNENQSNSSKQSKEPILFSTPKDSNNNILSAPSSTSNTMNLFKDIYYFKGKKQLSIDVCFKLEELIQSNKIKLEDLNNLNLIESLKDIDEKSLYLFDDFLKEQEKNSKKYQTTNKIDIDLFIYYLDSWKNKNLHSSKQVNNSSNSKSNLEFQIYIENVPKDCNENELRSLFEKYGQVKTIWLNCDSTKRGYGFVYYGKIEDGMNAIKNLNEYEIRPNKKLSVLLSQKQSKRIFIKNIPKNIKKFELREKISSICSGVKDVILFDDSENGIQDKACCYIEFNDVESANKAKSKMSKLTVSSILNRTEADEKENESNSNKDNGCLYVKNIPFDATENQIYDYFRKYGKINKITKKVDFCFVDFKHKDDALTAMHREDGKLMFGKYKLIIKIAHNQTLNKNDSGDTNYKKSLSFNNQNNEEKSNGLKRKNDCKNRNSIDGYMNKKPRYNSNQSNRNDYSNKENNQNTKNTKQNNILIDQISWD